MPRLSNRNYLRVHHRLKRYWLHTQMAFGYLGPDQQWQLHYYFQPTKDWSDDQLLTHRVLITTERPSLPHQAGRALAKLDEVAVWVALSRVRAKKRAAQVAKQARKRTNVRNKDRQVLVYPVVKPEPDIEKLVRLAAWFVDQQAREAEQSGEQDATKAA